MLDNIFGDSVGDFHVSYRGLGLLCWTVDESDKIWSKYPGRIFEMPILNIVEIETHWKLWQAGAELGHTQGLV